jgi:peptidylprolyl isomerase
LKNIILFIYVKIQKYKFRRSPLKKILFTLLLAFNLSAESVIFETTSGNIELKLFEDIAPKTTENFKKLVEKGYYNGVIFHRVIKNFMIQGGDPTGTGRGGESIWGKPFEDEFKAGIVFDKPMLLAMANRGRNTNGSQFFITTKPTPWLNGYHTIFGEVVSGQESVSKIENQKVDRANKPIDEQKIIKAYIKSVKK